MIRYDGLVNRTRRIRTLEDKANVTGYQWTVPSGFQEGWHERLKSGELIGYDYKSILEITDVDGQKKRTVRTDYYEVDKRTSAKQSVIGDYQYGLAGAYHGHKSRNWKPAQLTLDEMIECLNAGFSFAPGRFDNPPGESARSGNWCAHRQLILFDGDEWTDEHRAPRDLNGLLNAYPEMQKDFWWVGESISSRSSLKAELRTRLLLVLPFPVRRGEDMLWATIVDWAVSKYPFIARGVGVDKVRLSFGNARADCENRVLGGELSADEWERLQGLALETQRLKALEKEEQDRAKKERTADRQENARITTQLRDRGHQIPELADPLVEFCKVDAARLLQDYGLATHLHGASWHWYESGQGRSFELIEPPGLPQTITPFSNSCQAASPEADPTKPVGAHRFILYHLHRLDITKDADKRPLRDILASEGYGTDTETYRKAKQVERELAVKEGLKREKPAKPLRTEPSALPSVMRTVQENAEGLREAFDTDARVVFVNAETGIGKTERAIEWTATDKARAVLFQVPTKALQDEVVDRFLKANVVTMAWRSRFHGWTEAHTEMNERMRVRDFQAGKLHCIQPNRCEEMGNKGISVVQAVCLDCPVYAECRRAGYLVQYDIGKDYQVVVTADPSVFWDPERDFVWSSLETQEKVDEWGEVQAKYHRTAFVDEFKSETAYLLCKLHRDRIDDWCAQWQDEALGIFARELLTAFAVDKDPYKAVELAKSKSENEKRKIAEQLTQLRFAYEQTFDTDGTPRVAVCRDTAVQLADRAITFSNGERVYIANTDRNYQILRAKHQKTLKNRYIEESGFLTLEVREALAFGLLDDLTDVTAVSRRADWTILHKLLKFGERYPSRKDAPIYYQDDQLTFSIAPQLHKNVSKLIAMSATLDVELAQRAFSDYDTAIVQSEPSRWHDDAKLYQLQGAYLPKKSLLTDDGELTDTGAFYTELITKAVKRDAAERHVVIAMKPMVELGLWDGYKNVEVVNFEKAPGQNFTTDSDSGVVFWVLGLPEVPEHALKQECEKAFGNDDSPLEYNRDADRHFTDPRVQAVWCSLVQAKVEQALGRARLNRQGNIAILLTSQEVPSFTERAIPIRPKDFDAGIDGLQQHSEARLARDAEYHRDVDAAICDLVSGMSERKVAEKFRFSRQFVSQLKGGPGQYIVLNAPGRLDEKNQEVKSHKDASGLMVTKEIEQNSAEKGNGDKGNGDKLFNGDKGDGDKGKKSGYHTDIAGQVLSLFEDVDTELATREIVEKVKKGSRQKVNSQLTKLVSAGKLVKVKRGVYRKKP